VRARALLHSFSLFPEQQAQETEQALRANRSHLLAHNTFDWLTLGDGMAMSHGNRSLVKLDTRLELSSAGGKRPVGEFALWGAPSPARARSQWGLRIDKMQGSGDVWVGMLLTPFRPAVCKADELATRAWMLNDAGGLVRSHSKEADVNSEEA
jgi:hypothetical protein